MRELLPPAATWRRSGGGGVCRDGASVARRPQHVRHKRRGAGGLRSPLLPIPDPPIPAPSPQRCYQSNPPAQPGPDCPFLTVCKKGFNPQNNSNNNRKPKQGNKQCRVLSTAATLCGEKLTPRVYLPFVSDFNPVYFYQF